MWAKVKPILRVALVFMALVALSLAIWFAGPMAGWGEIFPLAGFWTRTILISILWLACIGWYGWKFRQRRKAQKALEAAVAAPEVTGDAAELTARMKDAIETLRKASGGRNFLYDLPWYVIIGPPGTGKTTALLNSGLKFPLASEGGTASLAGTGGTRYCDWWFAEDAVLIDTAGRYTTQDSDKEADEKSWTSFLSLLKSNRTKQPINGVIITISLEDLMTLPEEEIARHSNAIRKRLLELHEKLRVDFPVYALFTKADLVAGFNEFFSSFPEDRRRQVWGATFQTDNRKKNSVDTIPGEIDDLVLRLTEETADRLQAEPDPMSRIAIFGFPAQVARLREPVSKFLQSIFEPTRYHANAHLRGFYFTSGTQQGTAIDQVLGDIGASLGTDTTSFMSGKGRSYFIKDLLTKVIFQEAGWVSRDLNAIRRASIVRYSAITLICLVTLGLSALWGWSYLQNERLIASTNASVAEYRSKAALALDETVVADSDLHNVLDLLHKLRNLEAGYANRDKEPSWLETAGLGQQARLNAASEESYRDALERTFRSRIIYRLEQQMQSSLGDPAVIYEALKVYLMIGGNAPTVDDEFIISWMVRDWEDNLYRGAANKAGREELEKHLRAMLDLNKDRKTELSLNNSLVTSARQTLVRLSLAERAYSMIKGQASSAGLQDWKLTDAGGLDTANVFETVDGSAIEDVTVPGIYTYTGFQAYFLDQLAAVADNLQAENWVLGEESKDAVEAQYAILGRNLLEMYRKDYIAAWEEMFAKIRLKRMSADKPEYLAIASASSADSPIRRLIDSVNRETRLTAEAATQEGLDPAAIAEEAQGGGLVKEVANIAVQRMRDRATGWTRIGINLALEKSQNRLGNAPGGAQAKPVVPGEDVEQYFRAWHLLADGEQGNRPVDLLITNLYDIYQSLLLAATKPSQLERATANLNLQITSLRANASRLPTPLRTMMEGAVDDFEGDAAGSTVSQLNQALASEVTRVCQEITANQYPFAQNSGRDVPMAEFARLLAPNGVMDSFFAKQLSKYVDTSGADWDWKADELIGQSLSKATLREFQRAAEIRDAFFPQGSPMIGLNMTIRPNSLSGNAELALLEVNSTVVQSQQVGNAPIDLTWPGTGAGSASITLLPELAGRESAMAETGQWAFMRLISKGSVSKNDDGVSVRFVVGGREVSYKIEVNSLKNPFTLSALGEFKCPAGF